MEKKKWYYRVYLVESTSDKKPSMEVVVNKTTNPESQLFVSKKHRGGKITVVMISDKERHAYRVAEQYNHFSATRKNPKITARHNQLEAAAKAAEREDLRKELENKNEVLVHWASTGELLTSYPNVEAAAKAFGILNRTIVRVINGVKFSHKGLIFRTPRREDKERQN